MCGIAGYTHRNGVFPDGLIHHVTSLLSHRGPDQQGVYQCDQVSLGAVRLKIIDLESGSQPMFSDDGDTVLVFNGEIYNHGELRRELRSLGHVFHSRSDTEVVLHAFLQWDTECFRRFRGMFGLALWTHSTKRLLLARDRLGIKPLYIYRRGSDLLFGSELKAILDHPQAERRLDPAGLNSFLALNYVPAPHTLVAGVEKLPPGYWLEWCDGKIKAEPYWKLNFAVRRDWTEGSAAEELDSLIEDSVREHLISDVPLGVWLSGGVDSSTILHYAAKLSPSRLKTFSIAFPGRSYDEGGYARDIARRYDCEHREFEMCEDRRLTDAIEEIPYYSDEPSADAGALPIWFLSRMCREQVTVALSGEGADELFGGYVTYLADGLSRTLRRVPAPALRLALKALRFWPVSDEKISFEYKLKRFLQGSLMPAEEAHLFWNGTFSEEAKRRLLLNTGQNPLWSLFGQMPEATSVGYINRNLWLDQSCYLPDDILYKVDRMSMAHSLEVRPPFLDHRIVEFAASLPENFKVRGFETKVLLKRLMRGKLPDTPLRRKKTGLDIPVHEWFRGVLRPLLLDTLSHDPGEKTALFPPGAIRTLVRDHLDRRANLGYHLWGLMTLFLWMRKWRIDPAAAATPAPAASAEPVSALAAI